MTATLAQNGYGELIDDATLRIERVLPGPAERVFAYLTQSELRRQWLAAGDMTLTAGAPFEMTWRNDELTDPPGAKPPGFGEEHSMSGRIIEVDPPRKLVISWGEASEVVFELSQLGPDVMLTLIHKRAPNREVLLNVSAGWHAHIDVLEAKVRGQQPDPFWDRWLHLKAVYNERLPA